MNACHDDSPGDGLRARLLDRVRRSQHHESRFVTVRRDSRTSLSLGAGVREHELRRGPMAFSMLVELPAGAGVWPDSAWNQWEAVVMAGSAEVDGWALRCGDAAVAPTSARLEAGTAGVTLYLRRSRVDEPCRQVKVVSTLAGDAGWDDFAPGVLIRELWNGGERRSVLVRMHAGARVNAHTHALDEDCMMLDGEAFIGDTLLRRGEFQWAPQGSRHGAIHTDVGALFYVHGSLDPAAYL